MERLTEVSPHCAATLQMALPMNPFPADQTNPATLPPTTTKSGEYLK